MTVIKLQSSDGEFFKTDTQIVKCSGTIKTMLDDLGLDGEEEAVIPVPNVSSGILRLILQWANHHKNDPTPTDDDEEKDMEKHTDEISSWDADFFDVDHGTLFELIEAANYLHIKGLVACKAVANIIKGKSVDEIRKTFNITNDFTSAEKEKVRKET